MTTHNANLIYDRIIYVTDIYYQTIYNKTTNQNTLNIYLYDDVFLIYHVHYMVAKHSEYIRDLQFLENLTGLTATRK